MISGASPIGAQWYLEGLAGLEQQQIRTARELSSGYRVQDAADAPESAAALFSLGSSLASVQAYQQNLKRVQAETASADQAIGSAVTLFDNAVNLASQGTVVTLTADQRQNLAVQVKSLEQQLVGYANTTTEGRYIFGGDQDQSPPYAWDSAAQTASALTASPATRVFSDPQGQPVYQALTAGAIFDPRDAAGKPAPSNAFAALDALANALNANDPAAVASPIDSLHTVSTWLNQRQAYYGAAESRLTSEQNGAADKVLALQTQIGSIRDADLAQAATDLTQENATLSAATVAQAALPRKSLFDYLG
jgi:flagellar hook-associated protein 3 FlgL